MLPYGAPGQMDTLSFAYNAFGDPVSVVRPHTSTGSLDYTFRYDNKHRLTDLIGKFDDLETVKDGDYIEDWNRYFYDEHNNIVPDSFYFFGLVVNGRPTIDHNGSIIIQTYEYDAKGNRITKTVKDGAGKLKSRKKYVYEYY
jgi:YD repeat-containing protein